MSHLNRLEMFTRQDTAELPFGSFDGTRGTRGSRGADEWFLSHNLCSCKSVHMERTHGFVACSGTQYRDLMDPDAVEEALVPVDEVSTMGR